MMRGGAMRNRAPRFFGGFVLWLTFFASRRMRGMRGNFWNTNLTNFAKKFFGGLTQNARNARKFLEHESGEFREKVFLGPHAECTEYAEFFEHESGEWHEFFASQNFL